MDPPRPSHSPLPPTGTGRKPRPRRNSDLPEVPQSGSALPSHPVYPRAQGVCAEGGGAGLGGEVQSTREWQAGETG